MFNALSSTFEETFGVAHKRILDFLYHSAQTKLTNKQLYDACRITKQGWPKIIDYLGTTCDHLSSAFCLLMLLIIKDNPIHRLTITI